MASRFVFTEEAETQLLKILDDLADESESAAVRVRDAIYDAVGKLAERPGIGHTREDLTDRPVKFWSVYSYLVVYDPESRPLTIVAVLHGARDVGEAFRLSIEPPQDRRRRGSRLVGQKQQELERVCLVARTFADLQVCYNPRRSSLETHRFNAGTSNVWRLISPRAQVVIKRLIREANGNPRSTGEPYERDAVG